MERWLEERANQIIGGAEDYLNAVIKGGDTREVILAVGRFKSACLEANKLRRLIEQYRKEK